jgi:hypothetical protein
MTKLIYPLFFLLLMPVGVFAASDCRIVEDAQHYEVVCVGAPQNLPVEAQDQSPRVNPGVSPTFAGQRRPPTADLEAARIKRLNLIQQSRQL